MAVAELVLDELELAPGPGALPASSASADRGRTDAATTRAFPPRTFSSWIALNAREPASIPTGRRLEPRRSRRATGPGEIKPFISVPSLRHARQVEHRQENADRDEANHH